MSTSLKFDPKIPGKCNEVLAIAEELRGEIINFVNSYLDRMGMVVITDDPENEAVTTAAVTKEGEGHIVMSFYFKQKETKGKK